MNITMTPVNNFYTFIRTMTLGAPTINNSTTSSVGIRNASPLAVGPWIRTTGAAVSTLTNENWSQLGGITYYGFGGLNAWGSTNGRSAGYTYIAIGSDNTDTEVTDYVLKNEIDSAKYEVTLHIGNAEIINNKAKLPISAIVKAKDDIEIGEISVQKAFYYSNNSYQFMLARGAISDNDGNPISLSNGDTKTFQIDIEF